MKQLLTIITALMLICSAKVALAYDDLAVAVCEYELQHWELPTTIKYQRVAANVKGDRVLIDYTTAALNTKPKPDQYVCRFVLNKGSFYLKKGIPESFPKCTALSNASPKLIEKVVNSSDTKTVKLAIMKKLTEELKACDKKSKAMLARKLKHVAKIDFPLIALKIYPIKPEDTELKVAQ